MNLDIPEDAEELLEDSRVERLADKLRSEFGHRKLEDTKFVTFISPPRTATADVDGLKVPVHVQAMATFAVVSPNPREYAKKLGLQLMTHGTVALEDFMDDERAASHYAGRKDPAHGIFRRVVEQHLRELNDLKELIS